MNPNRSIRTSIFLFSISLLIALGSIAGPICAVDTIRFAVIGDRTSSHTEGVFASVLDEIERMHPEIIMSVGDYIDGQLDEPCWHSPVKTLFNYDGTGAKTDSTEFYFAWDENNLYLAAHCSDTDMSKLAAAVTEQDGPIYSEDCVGYFIRINPDDSPVYQMYFNPNGFAFDQVHRPGSDGYYASDRSWNGNYQVKTTKSEDGWIFEVAIPLSRFGVKYRNDNELELNFRRKQVRNHQNGNWQNPIDANPKYFGILHLC